MQRNTIISKKLRPYVGLLSVYSVAGLLLVTGLTVDSNITQQEEQTLTKPAMTTGVLLIIIMIAYLFIHGTLNAHKNANKFAQRVAYSYVKQMIETHPELSKFQPVLYNPASLKRITNLISNELRDSEQKQILKILSELNTSRLEDSENTEKMGNACEKIVQIIEQHASVHPEFIDKIHSVMFNEDYLIYVKKQQEINRELIKHKTK